MNWLHVFDSIDAPATTDLSLFLPSVFEGHPLLVDMLTNHQDFLLPYLNHHADIISFIGIDLYQWPGNSEPLMNYHLEKKAVDLLRVQKAVGNVLFLFSSLLSFTCKPNIHRHVYQGSEMYYIVTRNINEGERLTISNE